MSAVVEISVAHPDMQSGIGATVRLRAAAGRTLERAVALGVPELFEVEPGDVSIDAVFPSGARQSRQLTIEDGHRAAVRFEAPEPPRGGNPWLQMARDPRRRRARAAPARSAREAVELQSFGLESYTEPDGVRLLGARIAGIHLHEEPSPAEDGARILHVRDDRDGSALSEVGASGLALLAIESSERPGVVRVVVLPVSGSSGRRDVYVALRTLPDDLLPDVQVAPSDDLAAMVGYLERRDLPSMDMLKRQFLDGAVAALRGEHATPIAVAVGIAVLIRLGDLEHAGALAAELAARFPAFPDGAALHAAMLMRRPSSDEGDQSLRAAALAAARAGLPLLTDSLRLLREALAFVADAFDAEVEAARRWCNRIVRALDADNVFTTVTLDTKDIDSITGVRPNVTGGVQMNQEALQKQFAAVLTALKSGRDDILKVPGLAVARPGYAISGDEIEPALVLALHPPRRAVDVAALGAKLGVKVRITTASPYEQILGAERPTFRSPMQSLLDPVEAPDFVPKRGTYQAPTGANAPRLDTIDEQMTVTVCASPDAGWPVLRDFFAEGVKKRLTVAMYDFSAKHVEEALTSALEGTDATFRLVLDGRPASGGVGGTGINGDDRLEKDVVKRLKTALGDRFELAHASVGAGGAVPKAYHIKVAVADGKRTWLSSGNWQSSNLAPFDYQVAGDAPPFPLGRYNRDYHVVVANASLAKTYAAFIEYDATLGTDFAPGVTEEPFLLVPDGFEEPPGFAPIERFPPAVIEGKIKVTPLLTPDNFPGFVNKLLAKAKKRVWIQNQYIQPQPDGDNFPEFERLMELLGELSSKVDLRMCIRSPEEIYRDRILAAGVRISQMRRQSNCHAKLIVIDDEVVVVGSQNLSNMGFVANRDASLAFENEEITAFFAKVFEADWDRAGKLGDDDSFAVRVAAEDDEVPAGFTRVRWSSLYDSTPPISATGPVPVSQPAAAIRAPAATPQSLDLPFFGVTEEGKIRVESSQVAAAALRASGADAALSKLGKRLQTPSMGLPPLASAEALDESGWGVVWAPSISAAVKAQLRPLLDHRRSEAGDTMFHELDYIPGEDARAFLQRRGVADATIRPEAVPYHLLIVGDPQEIPFSFQTLLDVNYRVGRIHFTTHEAYGRYAQSVVDVETGKTAARDRVFHAFGPKHDGDVPTALSVETLVKTAGEWLDTFASLKKKHGLTAKFDAGDDATKARLLEILRGAAGRPELLFTAGHGLLVPPSKPTQLAVQGALITADWDGISGLDAKSWFAAADLPADANVHGLVAFLFACFGAGTPATDSFPTTVDRALAAKPFVAALPQALLSHPKGGALGVFGHVDRTLTWSIRPPNLGAPLATEAFARGVIKVLAGNRLGAATEELNERGATLASIMANALRPGGAPIDDLELVRIWTQQRDATAFILLGDPAARLPRP